MTLGCTFAHRGWVVDRSANSMSEGERRSERVCDSSASVSSVRSLAWLSRYLTSHSKVANAASLRVEGYSSIKNDCARPVSVCRVQEALNGRDIRA